MFDERFLNFKLKITNHRNLYEIEHKLRSIGNHVLSDTNRLGIWLFSLFELETQTEIGHVDEQQRVQSIVTSKLKSTLSAMLTAGSDHSYRGLFWCFEGY